VGSRAGLDAVEKRKILQCRKSNSDRPTLLLFFQIHNSHSIMESNDSVYNVKSVRPEVISVSNRFPCRIGRPSSI
jgi:hypothetical protein